MYSSKTDIKWQKIWEDREDHNIDISDPSNKIYCLVMFSYPSGDKLHVGHWYNFGPTDTWARFKKMKGFRVFEPMGFDAFGLPAENYAIKNGGHPKDITDKNTLYMEKQLKAIGAMYDWSRKLNTSRPEYYKWTQWLFLQLYKHGLAFKKLAPVNWCPDCGTVLANEQVVEGCCERCDTQIIRKNLEQWFFRITKYADDLLDAIPGLDWPEKTKLMQTNWIGRSHGAEIDFDLDGQNDIVKVFTTRADTLFGSTYIVLAPEHPLVEKITSSEQMAQVREYIECTSKMNDIERLSTDKTKTGVFTGAYAVNPGNGRRVPVWIADYVLLSYGTGAVMAVPAHDTRDNEFAGVYNLPVAQVIEPPRGVQYEGAYTGEGIMKNSGQFDGMNCKDGKEAVISFLEKKGKGRKTVNYRLRDWSISRQRYWGAPIPIINCSNCGAVPVPEKDLPVELPYDIDLSQSRSGRSPLASIPGFIETVCPSCGGKAEREADTMDTFVCSSWYYLRYPCAGLDDLPFDTDSVKKWLPVDMYVGGAEHACGHLLYSRFITRALYDMGHVNFKEPFGKLIHQGTITSGGAKMSKSKGNTVSPDRFVSDYGADTFRMYLMFISEYTAGGDWSDEGITGISRFLGRVWRLVENRNELELSSKVLPDRELTRVMHFTIKKVTEDIDRFSFNTAISRLMEMVNAAYHCTGEGKPVSADFMDEVYRTLILLLAPFAPHFSEEMWEKLGNTESVFSQEWPVWDDNCLKTDEVTIVIQVNGKVRANITVPAGSDEDFVKNKAMAEEKISSRITGLNLRKIIYIPEKLMNIVAN